MSAVNLGIAGTGRMAALMMPAFHYAAGVNASAACSSSKERARAFTTEYNIAASYDSLEAMLADDKIDAVYIANATSDHANTSIAALNAGKHVLCEKPFAVNARQGERVIVAAQRAGKLFMEGLWTHFLPAYARVYAAARAEKAGKPVHLYTDFAYPTTPEIMPRLFNIDGGGVLLDRAVYPISFALKLLGPVGDLHADVVRNSDGVDLQVNVQTRHEGGATAQLSASMIAMMSNSASIACERGLISIPPPVLGAETVKIEHFEPSAPEPVSGMQGLKAMLKRNPLMRRIKAGLNSGGERHPYGADQYLPQMQHFVHLIASGKTESDIVPHALSLDVLRVIDRIRAGEGR